MQSTESGILLIIILGTLILVLSSTFIIVFLFYFRRKQLINRQEKDILHARHQQEILQAQLEIQNQTLQHISGELHDNIGQLLTLARLQLNILEAEERPTRQQIEEVNKVVGKTIDELRGLSKSLDGDFVKDFGLVESLSHELQRIRNTGKYRADILTLGDVYPLKGQKEIVLFRMVQEMLGNTLKHAAAQTIIVTLHYLPELFTLTVQDDGKGFDYEEVTSREMNRSGAGLRNIQRRAELLGGTCSLQTAPGAGTKVEIQLPVVSGT